MRAGTSLRLFHQVLPGSVRGMMEGKEKAERDNMSRARSIYLEKKATDSSSNAATPMQEATQFDGTPYRSRRIHVTTARYRRLGIRMM